MSFVVFDTGALIAVDRGSRRMQALLERVRSGGMTILVPAGAVAQAWRDGARQARLSKLFAGRQTRIVDLNAARARGVGVLLSKAGANDVIDASVVLCARGHGSNVRIFTSDPADLARLDPSVTLISV